MQDAAKHSINNNCVPHGHRIYKKQFLYIDKLSKFARSSPIGISNLIISARLKTLLWILASPFVWLTLYFGGMAATVDNDLKNHGVRYDATATRIMKGGHGGKDVQIRFDFNGHQQSFIQRSCALETKVGDHLVFIALPTDINVHETLGCQAGNKQAADYNWAFVFFVFSCVTVWWRNRRIKAMAAESKD